MSKKTEQRDAFFDFFREEASELIDPSGQVSTAATADAGSDASSAVRPVPVLRPAASAPEAEQKAYWRTLRTFFRSGRGGGLFDEKNEQLLAYPALLAPYRYQRHLRRQAPAWIADAETFEREASVAMPFIPLDELLRQTTAQIAPAEGDARILKENLLRLEMLIREKISMVDDTFKAPPVLREAVDELQRELKVEGSEGDSFRQDLDKLKRQLPQTGMLLPFSPHAPLHLLATYLHDHLNRQRRGLLTEVRELMARLRDILSVEQEKSPDAKSPEQLHTALDFADDFLNFEELSSILPAGGSEAMPEERYHRIEKLLATLEEAEEVLFGKDGYLVVEADMDPKLPFPWADEFKACVVTMAPAGKVCRTATRVFDDMMDNAARIIGALRLGRLEVENNYQPEVHGDYFAHFDWRSFTEEEFRACPPVIIVGETASLLTEELQSLSAVIASERPLRVLLAAEDAGDLFAPESIARQEPAALAIAHRNIFVFQGAPVALDRLFGAFAEGVSCFSPALFHLFLPSEAAPLPVGVGLLESAAAESRAFPGLCYDYRRGPKWGSRFDIQHNPQPEADWPEHTLGWQDEQGKEQQDKACLTFADFAAHYREFSPYFNIVPSRYWNADLLPLSDYLALPADAVYSKVPYIWVVDANNDLQRAAVAWPLVLASRERLDFWHYLQENAGIHSYHVEAAVEQVRQEVEAAAEQKVAALESSHAAEIEKVREETAREAMERLAAMLLDLETLPDLASVTRTSTPTVTPKAKEEKPSAEPSEPAAPEEPEAEAEETLPLGEAWIETPLCTSCNECIEINKKIFGYNAEKQAEVIDPRGGPFADIVRAAENCPVSIIHPGAPQNPQESGLEELVKRAEPYN